MRKKSLSYRFYEMIPGLLAWTTITFPLWGAFLFPLAVAYFVIAFLIFWLYQSFKSCYLAIIGYFKIKHADHQNWQALFHEHVTSEWLPYADVNHAVIISSFKEPLSVIEMAVGSLASQIDIDRHRLHLVIAQEARAGAENNQKTVDHFSRKYRKVFGSLTFTEHPAGTPGETVGKHSNEAYAAKYFQSHCLKKLKLKFNALTLTTCDVDTIFHPKYFSALTYHFASSPHRYYRFWQSPIFWHHNINSVPAPTRIIGTMGNVIHIANIQEPDGLFFNYSCYSSSFQLIDSAGYWDPDMIPEDWHIFLQTFFSSGGKTSVEPIFLPTLVDAPDGKNYLDSLRNRYQQCLRHAWGAIDIPYALTQARLHPEIPFLTRFFRVYKLIETHFIWSTNWFILTLGTSLPVLLNPHFFQTSFGFNLPRFSNLILTLCLIPLAVLIILDWKLRPPSQKKGTGVFLKNLLQWPLMPLATLTLSVLPGLHSHTRLLFGRRLEYQTTNKQPSSSK